MKAYIINCLHSLFFHYKFYIKVLNLKDHIFLFFHSAALLFLKFRIQRVPKAVSHHIQRQYSDHNGKTWEQRHVGIITDIFSSSGKKSSPFWRRSRNTQSQEA